MEEPANRRAAEEAASRAKKEAERIAKELERDCSQTSSETKPRRKKHGESIYGPDGEIDYSTAPDVNVNNAPAGMRPCLLYTSDAADE